MTLTFRKQFFLAMCVLSFFPGLLAWPFPANASSVMAVGQDEGYSGKVMDRIISKWNPPRQLKREYRLKLRIGLDGDGNLLECKAAKSSGADALDTSACAAVKAAAPFGSPPYGMPADIYLTFWSGGTSNRASAAATGTSNKAAENRANALPEPAAQSTGKKSASKNVTDPGEGKKGASREESHPAAQRASDEKLQDAERTQEKYIARVTRALRNLMYVPKDAKPGTYSATAQVDCDKNGRITGYSLIDGSGVEIVDKYILQGLKRAKKIQPPPPGLASPLKLTFTLIRK